MKLTPRLAIYFVLYAATLMVAVSSLAYTSGLASLQAATISELSASASEKQSALNQWIQDKQSGIALLAADPATIASASALVSAPSGSPEAQTAHDAFVREVQPLVDGGEFLVIMLIDPQTGEVLAATDPNEEGKFKEDRLYFIHGKTGPYVQNVYYALAVQGPAMTAATPVRGSGGQLWAVLAGRIDLQELNAIVNRRSGLRQSDDAFLMNTSHLFVTQPYLVENPAVLQRGVHMAAGNQCLTRTSGSMEAEDYRGVPAVIVYRWLPERELCLIVKMDQEEAYASIRKFGGTVAVISILALLVGAFWAIVLARSLTRPILALQAGAARFGNGELDTKLPETARDELGMLAHEFNQMAASLLAKDAQLRAYAQTLEQKVQERTRELRESHARLEKVLEVETVGVMFWDLTTGCMTDANDAFLNLMGYDRHEVEARELTWQKLTPPEFIEASLAEIRKFQQTGRVGPYEKEYFRKDGTRQWLVFAGSSLGSNTCVEFCVDISDRKRAEERFRLVVESVPNSIVMVDRGGRIVLVNVQTERLFGYSRAELIGRSVDILVPDRFRTEHANHRALFLDHPSARPMGTGRDLFGLRKDGSQFPVEIGLSPIEIEQGAMVLASIVDITERKRAEAALQAKSEEVKNMSQQLWQAAKLATMGELAASIAHELNNPLATVSLRTEMLQMQFTPDDAQYRSLHVIDSEIKRMSNLVGNLLQFSRRSASQISTINVTEELTNTLELIQYHLRKNSLLVVQELSPDMPLIQADRQQLRQVFLNLFTNSADAMSLGGILTIRTWSSEKPETGITAPLQRSTAKTLGLPVSDIPQVFIEVSDTGEGIPADRVERVWEPFYTTKPEGKGTGLGLAICRRIIQEHGGTIEIISDGIPGKGTTVRVSLPAIKAR